MTPDPTDHSSTSGIRLATGNLSVDAIQHSSIGADPNRRFRPALPPPDELNALHAAGLDAYEDYIAWGTVEPGEGKFDFSHHVATAERLEKSGLKYVPYIWCHFPPTWLKDGRRATMMRCNAHGQTVNMLSIFDPRTLQWYERFYRALHKHMEPRIAETYACILGPFGEGNYPLPYVDWVVKLNHCHEGYWCGDKYALPAFRMAMKRKYGKIDALNAAWHSEHHSFADVPFPPEIATDAVPPPAERPLLHRRRWLDFISWYHQALIDFARRSAEVVQGIFGNDRVAIKPGGNSGWMNPLSWGTYCPGYAKAAGGAEVPVQSADSRGAYWADKWCSTAYAFYGVEYRTEAAGELSGNDFIRRTFSDVSCGASRLFTYNIDKHLTDSLSSLHLFTGERGITDIAMLAPTTTYFLNGDVRPAIALGDALRDDFDYDVLDELLITDGVLTNTVGQSRSVGPYRVIIAAGCRIVEAAVMNRLLEWVEEGGCLIWAANDNVEDVAGKSVAVLNGIGIGDTINPGKGMISRVAPGEKEIVSAVRRISESGGDRLKGVLHGQVGGVWMTERRDRILLLNLGDQSTSCSVEWKGQKTDVELPPFRIIEVPAR